jgi:hypothetical protein
MVTVFAIFVCAAMAFLVFNRVDSAMELDSLKEQIKLQRKEMHFLQSITNSALSACKMTVDSFESVVRESKRDVLWQGDDALVGPFRVKKKDVCIVSVEVVAGL